MSANRHHRDFHFQRTESSLGVQAENRANAILEKWEMNFVAVITWAQWRYDLL